MFSAVIGKRYRNIYISVSVECEVKTSKSGGNTVINRPEHNLLCSRRYFYLSYNLRILDISAITFCFFNTIKNFYYHNVLVLSGSQKS